MPSLKYPDSHPYSAQGTTLSPKTLSIAGKGKYIGPVSVLGLPAQTAWFRIDSTLPLSGFEFFGTTDDNQLAAYAGEGGTGAKSGVFAKIEKSGWTGIAFVNTEAGAASVMLTAYNDNGTVVATQPLTVGGHAKVVNMAESIFTQNIGSATYIGYSSDRNVVGFQLNGSADGTMLDGLPALGGTDSNDTISINSISPTAAMAGQSTSFTISVAYNLQSKENGIVYVGFNTGSVGSSTLVDNRTISKGSGMVLFTVATIPVDWGTLGNFSAYVNLSEYPHASSWVPLAADYQSITVF